jgi:succinate dehydrogenase / fumarate reductase cytochrome b subunit
MSYKGGGPMLAWYLHRISGVMIALLVGTHMIMAFMQHVWDNALATDIGNQVNAIYEAWWFQLFVVFFVLWHGVNGLRIIALDTWPKLLKFQREATWLQWFIIIPVYGLAVFLMVTGALGGQ